MKDLVHKPLKCLGRPNGIGVNSNRCGRHTPNPVGENGGTLQRSREVVDVWGRVAIRDSIPVQCTIVPTWTSDFFGTILCSGVDHTLDEGCTISSCI